MRIYVWYVQVSMKAWGNRPVQQELGVTGGWKVGAGNQSWVPCKSSTCPWLLSHLSSSILYTRVYIKFCSFSMKNSSWGICGKLVAHGSKLSSFAFIFSSGTYGFGSTFYYYRQIRIYLFDIALQWKSYASYEQVLWWAGRSSTTVSTEPPSLLFKCWLCNSG